ncbi:MAG: hypothetical protein HY670_00930 [Chloroflexi bacterium]|nr:hypothetical protein [Chloroflexota bacterium]
MFRFRHLVKPLIVVAVLATLLLIPATPAAATSLQGTVQSIGIDSIVVDGQTVIIGPNTQIQGTLTVGALVNVAIKGKNKGFLQAHNITVIKRVGYR